MKVMRKIRARDVLSGALLAVAVVVLSGCAAQNGGSSAAAVATNKDTPNVARRDAAKRTVFANYFALLKTMSPVPNWETFPDFGTAPGIQATSEEMDALKNFRAATP